MNEKHEIDYFTLLIENGKIEICDVPFWHYGDDLLTQLKEVGIKAFLVFD